MNKFTYNELNKVKDLIPNHWDNNSTHIIIPNINTNNINIGDKFKVKLESYILNQPPNFTLSENWNNGTFPPEEVIDIEVMRIVGKMIGVRAVGNTTKKIWEGWLPIKGFKII